MSDTRSSWVIDVGEDTFEKAVIERSHEVPVVVDFHAEWCGPCKVLGPLLEKLAEERAGDFVLAKVDIDEQQRLAAAFQVSSVPAVSAIKNGKMVDAFVGVLPEAELRRFIDQLQPSEAEELVERAEALAASDAEGAAALYRDALEKEPALDAALVPLAGLLIERLGRPQEAAELLERVTPGGERADEVRRLEALLAVSRRAVDLAEEAELRARVESGGDARARYELGCRLAADGRYEEALQALVEAGEADKAIAKTDVKEAMVEIFWVVGSRSALADEYRERLARMLY